MASARIQGGGGTRLASSDRDDTARGLRSMGNANQTGRDAREEPANARLARAQSLLVNSLTRQLSGGSLRRLATMLLSPKDAVDRDKREASYEKMVAHFQLRQFAPRSEPGDRSIDLSGPDTSRSVSRFYRSKTFQDRDEVEGSGELPNSDHDFPRADSSRDPSDLKSEGRNDATPSSGVAVAPGSDYALGTDESNIFRPLDGVEGFQSNAPAVSKRDHSMQQAPRSKVSSRSRTIRRFLRRQIRRWRRRVKAQLTPWTPASLVFKIRWFVLAVAFAAQLLYLPLVHAYFRNENHTVDAINKTFELVFCIDVALKFNTSYYDKATFTLVTSRRRIAERYLGGWFLPDLLSAIPVDWVHPSSENSSSTFHIIIHVIFRVPRLIHIWALISRIAWVGRVVRVGTELFTWLLYSRYSHLMRIVRMILLVVLTAHYIACGWHLVTGDDPNAPNAVPPGSSVWDQYVSDLYYAVLLIQGQGVSSGGTTSQNLFSVVAVLVGSIVLAIVFGNVAMLVANFNANSTSHQRKMEAVFATMNKLRLPQDLRDRIHQYYEYVWHEYESLDGDVVKFSKELTHTLALEVGLYRHMDLVMNVPFWRGCSPDFVKQLVLSLSVRVYLPDDYVVRAGEVGTEMYLVNRGMCEFADVNAVPTAESPGKVAKGSRVRRKHTIQTDSMHFHLSVPKDGTGEDVNRQTRLKHRRRSSRSDWSSPPISVDNSGPGSDVGGPSTDDERGAGSSRPSASVSPVRPMKLQGASKNARQVHAGQSFNELALLHNYRRSTTLRAVTFVEMCILSRDDFQRILMRYSDDRREVLRAMLNVCVEKEDLPSDWNDLCRSIIMNSESVSSSAVDSGDTLPIEVKVDALLNHIDRPATDGTILFGFQSQEDKMHQTPPPALRRRISSNSQLEKVLELATPRREDGSQQSGAEVTETNTSTRDTKSIDCDHLSCVCGLSRRISMLDGRISTIEAQVGKLNDRVHSLETHHHQSIKMLRDISTCVHKLHRLVTEGMRSPESAGTAHVISSEASSARSSDFNGYHEVKGGIQFPLKPVVTPQRLDNRTSLGLVSASFRIVLSGNQLLMTFQMDRLQALRQF